MSIRVACSNCGKESNVSESLLGKLRKCPCCGSMYRATASAIAASGAAASVQHPVVQPAAPRAAEAPAPLPASPPLDLAFADSFAASVPASAPLAPAGSRVAAAAPPAGGFEYQSPIALEGPHPPPSATFQPAFAAPPPAPEPYVSPADSAEERIARRRRRDRRERITNANFAYFCFAAIAFVMGAGFVVVKAGLRKRAEYQEQQRVRQKEDELNALLQDSNPAGRRRSDRIFGDNGSAFGLGR